MMELALALGQSQELLASTMTEREFRAWGRYAERWGLPARRIEMYLAQIAWVVARTMGGAQEVALRDFLFEPQEPPTEEEEEVEDSAEEARRDFQFNPRMRKP
jgi:hypothetical protein